MRDARADFVPITGDDVRVVLADPTKLSLVAQPIVDVQRAVVTGYETLARFQLGRPAPPDKVFAAAAQAGIGDQLEALVLERALDLATQKPPNTFVTVNVDPLNILSERVRHAIDAYSSFRGVVFELTEQHDIEDLEAVNVMLDSVKSRGALVAIDDAGAGYSGLKQILDLRPQLLKVDRDLITAIHTNEAKRALVQMLGELAGRLDAWLLAEGIEDEDECHALFQLGVPLLQGYFLGRPAAPWADLEPKAKGFLDGLRLRQLVDRASIAQLVERCFVIGDSDTWPDRARITVRVDATRRPLEMRLLGEDGSKVRHPSEILRVKRDAAIAEVALRASTRSERYRWDPVVCIDERGNLEGIVPMHRLVAALAGEKIESVPDSTTPGSGIFVAEQTRH